MKLYFESTKWYDDKSRPHSRKVATALRDAVRVFGKDGTSMLVSAIMNDLGLTYSNTSIEDDPDLGAAIGDTK